MSLCLAACAVGPTPSLLDDLQADAARCDARYAHGPEAPADAALAWRDCVHQAVRQLLLPVLRLPDVYRLLLLEDRRLTEAVLAGEAGRAERAQRLRDLALRIEAVEGGDAPRASTRLRGAPRATTQDIAEARAWLVDLLSQR